jgi:tetratricopeptide (TPR) repeat protein
MLMMLLAKIKNESLRQHPTIPRWPLLTIILVAAMGSSMIFYEGYALEGKMVTHASSITEMETGSGGDRIALWERTLRLVGEDPLFGKGLSNWKIEVLKYGNEKLKSEDNLTFYQRPHNDYLWIMAETGVLGLLLYLLILSLAIVQSIQLIFREPDRERAHFQVIVLTILSGYLAFSFFSFPRERIVQNVYLALLLAAIVMQRQEFGSKDAGAAAKYTRLFQIILLLLLGFTTYLGYKRFNSEIHLKEALLAKDEKEYTDLYAGIKKASNYLFEMDPTSTPLAWYSGFALYQQKEFEAARSDFKRAYVLNPYHIHVLNNLGSSFYQAGEADSAAAYYLKAIQIAPNFAESRLNLSAVLFNQKMTDSAYNVISKIDLNTTEPRYLSFLKTIIKAKIRAAFDKDDKPELPDDEGWYLALHKMALEEHKSIEKLIFEKEMFLPNEPTRHE